MRMCARIEVLEYFIVFVDIGFFVHMIGQFSLV